MPAAVWGLDIGQSSIKAVRLERAGSLAQLTNFDVIEIAPGEDENTRPSRVRAALTELLNRRRIGQDPVLVALPGNQTFFRPFALPPAPPGRLAGIVGFEARNQIPFPISEVLWDFKQIAPSDAGEMRVGLIAVRRELVEQIITLLRDFKLQLEAIQVAPMAIYNLVRYEFGESQRWLVLDAGARVTDFVVVDREEFWCRPLPQSGNDLTRALEQKFRMSFEEAEALKLKMGESKQAKKIFQVIEPMLRGLVGDIQRTVGYYKGIRKDADIDRVLAIGNAFRMPGMVKFLSDALDIKISSLTELGRLRMGPGIDAGWWREELPSMAVALGLGIQGLGLAAVSLELLPEYILHERMLRRKRPIVAAGVGLALAASALSYLAAGHRLATAKDDINEIKKGLADVQKWERVHKAAEPAVKKLERELADWSETTARERGWILECLDLLSRAEGVDGRKEMPVLGPRAADGNGVYVKTLYVSRDDPFKTLSVRIDPTIEQWYKKVSGVVAAAKSKGVTRSSPMVVILQGDVAGPIYKGNDSQEPPEGEDSTRKQADTEHAKRLEKAIRFSSRVELTEEGKKHLATEEDVVVGFVGQSGEDRKAGAVRYFASPGAEHKVLDLKKHVKRLAWFRNVERGSDWIPYSAKIDSPARIARIRDEVQKAGAEPIFNWRDYLSFTLAWVYDDGSTQLFEEEASPP